MNDLDSKNSYTDSVEDFPLNIEQQVELRKIREEVAKRLVDYRKTIDIMAADAPIQVLCLPADIQAILLDNGLNRVYSILDMDFTKIKGLGVVRIRKLTTCLNEFLSMF
jgi:hypothetical protein